MSVDDILFKGCVHEVQIVLQNTLTEKNNWESFIYKYAFVIQKCYCFKVFYHFWTGTFKKISLSFIFKLLLAVCLSPLTHTKSMKKSTFVKMTVVFFLKSDFLVFALLWFLNTHG